MEVRGWPLGWYSMAISYIDKVSKEAKKKAKGPSSQEQGLSRQEVLNNRKGRVKRG